MNTIITYTKDVPVWKHILAVLFALLFLYGLLYFNYLTVIWLIFAINLTMTEGIELDLSSKTYRKLKSILGIKFGKWQLNPGFEYISVFRTQENQTVTVVTASATFREKLIVLNLFFGNKHITVFKTRDKNVAFKTAKHIALALDVDILDATEREKVWL